MKVPACTKITPEEKMTLEYLASKNRGATPSDMIRRAILAAYKLDSPALQAEARSFFDDGARHVAQMRSA